MSRILVGVMGPGAATDADVSAAFELGQLIAQAGWVLISGGRNAGVMDAVNKGAKAAGGLTVGILPAQDTTGMSAAVDIPIVTGMGQARNNVNVLSSAVVFACGIAPGTVSEIALALKAKRHVIMLGGRQEGQTFFKSLDPDFVHLVDSPRAAVALAKEIIANAQG
jgi:uncharacterized protein (TIGR00725 family)